MITITTERIGELLRDVFPSLIDWNPTDEEYAIVPGKEAVDLIVKRFPPDQYKNGVWECEEIAKALVVDVRRWEANTGKGMNWAIGVANCSRLKGEEIQHTINVLIVDGVVTLLDMQTGEHWQAERGQDEIYFVEM